MQGKLSCSETAGSAAGGVITLVQRPPLLIQVITRLIVGGAQLTILGLCEGLREHFEVRVISGPDEGPEGSLRSELEALVPVLVLPDLHRDIQPIRDLGALRALRRTFLSDAPAIIHTHSSKAGVLGRIAAPRPATRVVHTVHGWGFTPADAWWTREAFIRMERLVARRTDALVAVSADVRDEGCRLGIAERDDYYVIPEYVDYRPRPGAFQASRERARKELRLAESDRVLGWIGRFVPQKDPRTLAAAIHGILVASPDLRAVLIGDGPQRPEIEQRVSDLGLSDRVLFTGVRRDARALLAAFDVLIHVSRWEGQPRVVQEAIAERVPVVATRVSGLTDIVIPHRTGYLVDPGDARGLVDATLRVLDRRGVAAPLPGSVVEEIARRHGHEASLNRHLHLYDQLLTSTDGIYS